MDAGVGSGIEVDTGLSAGSGYVNGEFELKLGNTHKGTGEGVSASIGGGSRRRRTICFGFLGDR